MSKQCRGANGSGSIKKRKDGRYEARAFAGYDPITGKPKRISFYSRSLTEARKWLTKTCAEIDSGTHIDPCKMPLSVWLENWLKSYVSSRKHTTYSNYEQHIRLRIVPYIGDIKLCDLRQINIQRLVQLLLNEKNYSAKTVCGAEGVLHKALEKAKENHLIRDNPCDGIELPKLNSREPVIMTREQYINFLEALKGSEYENALYLSLRLGLRKAELIGLTWDCIDFENKTIRIYRQYVYDRQTHSYHFDTLKNSKPRELAMSDSVLSALSAQQEKQNRMSEMASNQWQNEDGFVFTNENGHCISHTTLHKHFKRICTQVGLDDMCIHDLRHNFASYSLSAGSDIKTVQDDLGHRTASFTMEKYLHPMMEIKRIGAERLDQFVPALHSEKDVANSK